MASTGWYLGLFKGCSEVLGVLPYRPDRLRAPLKKRYLETGVVSVCRIFLLPGHQKYLEKWPQASQKSRGSLLYNYSATDYDYNYYGCYS